MQLSGAKARLLGRQVGGKKADRVQLHMPAIPIRRAPRHLDKLVGLPLLEDKGAVAHHVSRPCPGGVAAKKAPEPLQDGNWHREREALAHELRKERCRILQGDLQGPGIHHTEADLGKVRLPPLVEVLGSRDVIELVGVLRRKRGSQDPLERLVEVIGGHGLPIRPFRRGPEVEGVDHPVRRHIPTRCDARHGMEIGRIDPDHSLEQRLDDVVLRDARDRVGIKVRRIPAVSYE
jgi:hypothetical protein